MAPNDTLEGRALNRRVEIEFVSLNALTVAPNIAEHLIKCVARPSSNALKRPASFHPRKDSFFVYIR